jgi:dUTP pyrophosphatase
MASLTHTYNPNRRYLPPGIQFDETWHNTFKPTWKGQFLFIALDSPDTELEEKYKNAIANHNSNVDNCFPDSGFDLFLPIEFSPEKKTEKIDYNIKAAMFKTISSLLVRPENQNALSFDIHEPMPYYLYPRSSISKTRVRLANNVGIIDSGYRGNIGAYFDVELPNAQTSTEPETVLEKHQRVLQICSNDLSPFKVILIKNIGNLGATERGQGGFGSTGI